jgi:hypothetical protein
VKVANALPVSGSHESRSAGIFDVAHGPRGRPGWMTITSADSRPRPSKTPGTSAGMIALGDAGFGSMTMFVDEAIGRYHASPGAVALR